MKKKLLALLLLLGLLCAVLCGCGDGSAGKAADDGQTSGSQDAQAQPTADRPNEITVGIAQDLDESLDPHKAVAAGTKEVMFNVFEGLMKPTPDGDLIPAVAERYEISEDRLTYTFTIREGIEFHNGDPVTGTDVLWSIRRCMEGGEADVLPVEALSSIQHAEAKVDTVTLTLDQPNAEFLSCLTLAVLPEGYDGQDTAPVGTGPFKFVSRAAQDNIVLEKFAGYWGEPAYLDKVTYKIIENADSILMSLQSGAVDLFAHLTSTQVAQLGDDFNIEEGTMNLVQAMYLNNAEKPFDDVRVRQALCYAVDRQQILDLAFDGYGSLIGSSMYPAFGKYFDESLTNYYGHDVEKAKALLADAGYPDGFSMTITAPSNYTQHMDAAQVIIEQLKAVGITAEVEQVEWSAWVSDVYRGRQYEATVSGIAADDMTAREMLVRYMTEDRKNFIAFSDPEYDEVLAKALSSIDGEEQTALYQRAEEILNERAASLWLQDMCDLVVMNPALDGFTFYSTYVLDMSTIGYR